jgi:hypothetical protein
VRCRPAAQEFEFSEQRQALGRSVLLADIAVAAIVRAGIMRVQKNEAASPGQCVFHRGRAQKGETVSIRHMETFALFRLCEKRLEDFAGQRFGEPGGQCGSARIALSITGFNEMRDPIPGNECSQIEASKRTHDSHAENEASERLPPRGKPRSVQPACRGKGRCVRENHRAPREALL